MDYTDKKWDKMIGGYKQLFNPVRLLQRIENGDFKAWDEIWDELHHQGDIGDASYASVIQLINIHLNIVKLDYNLYSFVSTIMIERNRKTNPDVPKYLKKEFDDFLEQLFSSSFEDLNKTTNSIMINSILGFIALYKKQYQLGLFITYCDEDQLDEITEECYSWNELYKVKK